MIAALLLAGCGDDSETSAVTTTAPVSTTVGTTTTTSTTLPPTTTTTAPAWVVGAAPLPLRPDGFGEIQPTPPVLVNRSLPTVDVLPPPASGAYESTIEPIGDAVRTRMGGTWQEGCPVAIEDLRYVTLSFHGFDGELHTGELVVHADVAGDVTEVFRQLFDAGFPMEEMRLVTDADLAAPPTGDGNNTAAFVCRTVRGGSSFSAHASGLAIDLNPFMNPYTRDDLVLPELASAYVDRGNVRPGMVLDGDAVVRAFDSVGWDWGGRWDDPVDRMHFTASGT
jgi:hypothetical protein